MKNVIIKISSLSLLVCMLFVSCGGEKTCGPDSEHLNVNKDRVMRYVLCPEDTVDYILQVADSIYRNRGEFRSLEQIDLYEEWMNTLIDLQYGDTIPFVVSLYASYDAITTCVSDEISSVFVWHDVMERQIASFLGKNPSREDVEIIFRAIEDILYSYSGGAQREMNVAAMRDVMLADYRLVDAYIALMDKYDDREIVGLVHQSYRNVLDSYTDIVNSVTETYSDRPRQMAVTFMALMDERRTEIEVVTSDGAATLDDVKKILKPHKMKTGLQD